MKRLLCSLTFLAATSTAASGLATQDCFPLQCCADIFRPCGVVYGVYGQLLYLQPNGSDFYYGIEAISLDPPLVSPDWKVLEIDPDYHLGFEIGASFLFNPANVSLELNWERLHAHDH